MTAKALICEYAEAIGTKLYVCGGNVTDIAVVGEPPYPVHVALAVVLQIPWHATDQQHELHVELIFDGPRPRRVPINYRPQDHLPEGERGMIRTAFHFGRPAELPPGSDLVMPVVFPLYGKPLDDVGPYYFSFWLDGIEVDRVSFRVRPVEMEMVTAGQ
jgi:hypothetical protein